MDPRDKHEDDGRGWQPRAVKTVAPETGLSLLLSRSPRGRRRFALSAAAFFRGGSGGEHLVTEGDRGEAAGAAAGAAAHCRGRRSEEHTSGLQSLMRTSYAGFCV